MILARLLSAAPLTDGEHVDLTFRRHYDAWHTDAYGQNPAPFQRNPNSGGRVGPPYPWRPYTPVWDATDALFGTTDGMGIVLNTQNSPTTLDVYGSVPVNVLAAGNAPQIPLQATTANTGGTILPGSYLIAIGCSPNGPVSSFFVAIVVPPGTNTNTVTVSGIYWGAAASTPSVWVGENSLVMRRQLSFTPSSNDTYGNPTVIALSSITPDGVGLPDPNFNSLLVQAKTIIHGGVWGAVVTHRGTSGGFAYATVQFAGASFATNQWAGYVMSQYSVPTPAGVALNWVVASNTADTIYIASGTYSYFPAVGAVCVMRAAATSITSNTIGDANFVNFYGPSGLTPHAEIGNLIRIIAGTGKGQPPAQIAENTSTVFTIAGTWAVTPDSTSVYIVEEPTWRYSLQSSTISNNSSGMLGDVSIPLNNFLSGSLLVEALTLDSNDNWSVERYAPLRELYVPAPTSTGANPGYIVVTPVAGVATLDLALGKNFEIALTSGTPPTIVVINSAKTIVSGNDFKLYVDQDATGGRTMVTFTLGAGGFAEDVPTQDAITTALTRTTYACTFNGSVFGLDSFRTNGSIT